MIRRPPRSTLDRSSAASDVYKRQEDAIPYIIAEIPTNPRVEVPDMEALRTVLSKKRKTASGFFAVDPVFILDQTFCPNVHFLGDGDLLSTVRTIAYVSGSKFPSGGLCTCLLYTSPSPRDRTRSRMPSSA